MASALKNDRGEYGFPLDLVDPRTKISDEYGLKFFRAVYSRHIGEQSSYRDYRSRYVKNRKYAEGTQSITKYKDLTEMNGDTVYANLDFSVIPIAAKFVDLLVGEMMNLDYEMRCNAVDLTSRTKRDEHRRKLEANMELKDFSDWLEAEVGSPMIPDGEKIPESNDEIELDMQMNFKLATEVAMEEALKFVFENNYWDQDIKRKVVRDLISIKKGCVRVYIDHNDDLRVRYSDPINVIVPYSEDDNFRNVKYFGEVMYIELGQLRKMSRSKLTEEQLFDIAKMTAGRNGNRKWNYGSNYNRYYNNFGVGGSGISHYDDFTIEVLDLEFHSLDTMNWEVRVNKKGARYVTKKEGGEIKKNREVIAKEIDNVYGGYWVVGTEHMLDYGKKEDLVRELTGGAYSSDTMLSWIFFSPENKDMENKSIVERMEPHADQIQLIGLKIQLLVAKLAPDGLAIDVSALKDVFLGKGKKSNKPLELQEIYQQTGVFYYNGETEEGIPMNRKPVEQMHSQIGNQLQGLLAIYNHHIQQIRDVTGINELRSASSIDRDAPVRTQEMAMSASRNATRPILDAYLNIFQRTAKMSGLYLQDMADQKRGLERFAGAIGEESVKVLEQGKGFSLAELGIAIDMLPDEEEKSALERDIQIALTAKDIRLEDAVMTRQVGNTKNAYQYLVLSHKRTKKEREEEAATNSEQNAIVQERASKAKAEAEIALKQAEAELEARQMEMEYTLKDEHSEKEHQRKMDEIKLTNEWKSVHIQQASEEDFKNTSLSKTQPQPRAFQGVSTSVSPVTP